MENKTPKTKEPQYQCCLDFEKRYGLQTLGLMSSHTWLTDPKRLVFVLSRYKFVAKMFSGMQKILEIGCADAFGTRIVSQEVESLVASDFDPILIKDAKNRIIEPHTYQCITHNILEGPIPDGFDGAYALDVIEHISQEQEAIFISNIIKSVKPNGTVIIGTPSIESQEYASPASKQGHINCKDGSQFKNLLLNFFNNVFIFSMNDEVIHTGFYPMANYLMALCCYPK
ncbi:methyltransferase domain-containing protein [Desulfococcaceae bacterium HSG9]|nr:methyltransferase domain-containing protein [Desulfococcaceae bacterium HSG9]